MAALIEFELGHIPFQGDLYAFIDRARSKVKRLFWEDNGFVLYYKRLSEEKFKWLKLIRCCDDGQLRMSNIIAENTIRPFVIGLKAWLLADTVERMEELLPWNVKERARNNVQL